MDGLQIRPATSPSPHRFVPQVRAAIDAAVISRNEPPADDLSQIDTLLFLPLAPVIEPAPAWRHDMPGIPATALPVLGASVCASLASIVEPIAAIMRSTAARDGAVIAGAGALLWPLAARVLDTAPRPPDWATTGLPADKYPAIAAGVAAILHEAPIIESLANSATTGGPSAEAAVRAVLDTTAPRGPGAWALVIEVLLARLPQPDALLRLVTSAGGVGTAAALRAATERAVTTLLDRLARRGGIRGPVGGLSLHEAGLEARRLVALLDGVGGQGAGPDRRRGAEALRQRLETSCGERFVTGLADELIAPIHALSSPPGTATLARLEAGARDLRRLETEARRIGGTATPYETLLRQASAMLKAMPADAPLALIDRVRLVEILTGPEDAVALLTARRQ